MDKIIILAKFWTLLFLFTTARLHGQEIWSLQRCLEYAKENSLSLRQAKNNIEFAELSLRQSNLNRLPSLSASTALGMQFGRTIDPVTNSFDNRTIGFQSVNLNANATLFAGGQIANTIRQNNLNFEVAQADAEAAYNTLALNIANAYLQVLLAEEQLENAERRRKLSVQQLENTDKLIQVGTIPANDRLDVLTQIANDEQAVIQTRNQIDISYLNLKLLMQLDPVIEIKVEKPQILIPADTNPDALTFAQVFSQALSTQPQIRSADLNLKSAELGVDIAQGALFPTLVAFAGLDTRWSSVSQIVDEIKPGFLTQTVRINGMDVLVEFPTQEIILKKNPYLEQINQNFGQSIGLSLQIPIFNNGRNQINVERARLNIANARVQSEQIRQQLKNDVQLALANARASRRAYDAAQRTADAAKIAFENAEKRFRLGTINNLQLFTARNTFDIAETNLIVAKYDYLFRLKVLDFYLGKMLNL